MTTNVNWLDVVQVVRGLQNREVGPPVRGSFAIRTNESLRALLACLANQQDTNCTLTSDEDPATLEVGQSVEVSISPRLGFGQLKLDIGSLLAGTRKARIKEPSFFLLVDEISSTDVFDDEHLVSRYRTVIQFVQLLKRAAAFLDPDEPSLVFVRDGKFELPIEYDEHDLKQLSMPALQALLRVLPEGNHQKQCASILAEVVISMTYHLASQQRFRHLLINATEIKKQFEQSYQLFAAGFSYEKVRDQVEAARVEYSGKIHKVFSDIQNQLLGIPVATIIVATQMKDAKTVGYEFWVNNAVLIGCWVFSVLMIFLLHNQSHTLSVLRDEIQRQKRQLNNEYSAVASSFAGTFGYLSKRTSTQQRILWVINGFVMLGWLLSHIVYLKLTPPARDWVVSCVPLLARWF